MQRHLRKSGTSSSSSCSSNTTGRRGPGCAVLEVIGVGGSGILPGGGEHRGDAGAPAVHDAGPDDDAARVQHE
ncbi:hypothetical protein, partial [Microbispora sp. NPDC046933]|uniref:hypothetical protein n=1 Tax=Microbispora sp. NPDC046933 TaxID=3155618 RepID=UPI0033E000BB